MTGKQLLNILATSEEARNIIMASLLFAGLVSETEELELDDIITPQKQGYDLTEVAKKFKELWPCITILKGLPTLTETPYIYLIFFY